MAEAAATVGNYVLERELGRGGMGAVYAGVHKLVGRRAAVKVLLPDLSRKQELVERFFNEARAAGRVKHPSIVDIYDFGYAGDGSAYIVMELLEGETLASRLKATGPMPIPVATGLARQVANALGAAHAAGIVHRDLKPDNVFLVKDPEVVGGERVKLLDFGIAKLATDSAGVSATVTGAILGTPHYMSPEQCEGARVVDARTDLYSLGCMLFQMLTGQLPFDSPGIGGLIGMHLHVPPPLLRTRCPNASPELEAVIARLLAKSPDDRFQNAEAVATVLATPSVASELPPMATLHPAASTAAATAELGTANTMHPTDRATRELQARAATELASDPSIMAEHVRPPTLPRESATDLSPPQPAGKTRPPRGDDPTMPSLPPDMTAPRVQAEPEPARASGGRRTQVMIIVTVVVVALGAVLLVNFSRKSKGTAGGAIVDHGSEGSGSEDASGSGPGTDLAFTPPPPDAAIMTKPPADPGELDKLVTQMKSALAGKKYADVKDLYQRVGAMTDGCGDPCAGPRSAADEMWTRAQAEASKRALDVVGRKVKAGDCTGARKELENSEDVIEPEVGAKLDEQVAQCKPKTKPPQTGSGSGSGSGTGSTTEPGPGSGSGSGSGPGPGSGSGSDSGSGDGADESLMEAFKNGEYAVVLEQCSKKKNLRPKGQAACAISACNLKKPGVAKAYLGRIRAPAVRQGIIQACATAGVDVAPPAK